MSVVLWLIVNAFGVVLCLVGMLVFVAAFFPVYGGSQSDRGQLVAVIAGAALVVVGFGVLIGAGVLF